MKRINVLGYAFSFFIAVFLTLSVLLTISQFTVLNKGYLLKILDQSNYYQGITDSLTKNFKQGAGPAGLEPSIYDDFFHADDIKMVAVTYIDDFFENKEASIDSETFKEELSAFVDAKMMELGISPEATRVQQLDAYLDSNVDGYVQYLEFPFIKYLVMGIDMAEQIVPYVIVFSLIMIDATCFFLYRMHLKKKEFTKYLGCSLITSGMMLSLLPLLLLMNHIFVHIKLSPEYYYHFFINFIHNYLYVILSSGVLLIILGIVIENLKFMKSEKIEEYEEMQISN